MLAEDRTVLAAERTFASWLRTGLAFLASGLAAQHVLYDPQSWEVRVLATVMLVCAVASFAAGAWRDAMIRIRLPNPDIRLLPRILTFGVSLLLIAVSIPAALLVWRR